jgi:hypothetical protein
MNGSHGAELHAFSAIDTQIVIYYRQAVTLLGYGFNGANANRWARMVSGTSSFINVHVLNPPL